MSLSKLFGSRSRRRSSGESVSKKSKEVSRSVDHDHAQVVFNNTAKDGSGGVEMGRELFSFPKPEQKETMADYINNHKEGDIFPYLAITGKEEESKDSRLARMRAFVSPYGKSVKPEMRINGIILDMLSGGLHIDDLKAHVDKTRLTRDEARENKRFKVQENVFNKPYIQIRKIIGEFVPLLSGTSDYTDLIFSLQDDRLLEHQVIVQSNRIPTNSSGIFELSCDYCIPTKDIRQLSIKYDLARPIMKDDFQWGSVSLSISISESDTPYLTPKVEAMAIVRAPYTAMEEQVADPDHKDITYTSGQIKKFREMYSAGDIADNDEPLKEKMKKSSYSKSSMRGGQKAIKGPDHLGGLSGWEMMSGMKKNLLPVGEASVSVISGSDEDDFDTPAMTKEKWEKHQEEMRVQAEKDKTALVKREAATPEKTVEIKRTKPKPVTSESEDSEPEVFKQMKKKRVGFNVHDV